VIPLLIDTDSGVDDALALWAALAAEEIRLLAVTVTGGNVPLTQALANTGALLGLARAEVPYHAGAARPLLGDFESARGVHGANGLAGLTLPPGPPPAPGRAPDAIRALLRTSPAPLTLLGLGPATNLALALATEPELAPRIARLVLMTGGATDEGRPEFNARNDPLALAILLGLGLEVVIVPLSLTRAVRLGPADLARFERPGGAVLAAARSMLRSRLAASPGGVTLHDPCALFFLLRPELFTGRPLRLAVALDGAERGATLPLAGLPNVLWLERLDREAFLEALAGALARLP
jgi:inosine-uridine nucleoside N-ribohydrolase